MRTGLTRKTINLYPATMTALSRIVGRHHTETDAINRSVLMYDFITRYADEDGAVTLINPKTGERNIVLLPEGGQ